ncbi:MAG: general secretion pathway protein GspB [Pseudomonadales bacterium]
MSFILEAQKRDAANFDPDVAAQLALEAHRASRWRWIWLGIGAAVLANVLIIGYFFNPFAGDSGQRRSNETLSAPDSARELVVRPRERTGPTRPERTRAPAAQRPATATPARPRPQPATATTAPAPAPSGRGRVLSPEQAAELNIGLPDQPAAAKVAAPEFETSSPAPQPRSEPAAASSDAKVLTLADLNAADRAAFPKLEFSTHIFADDPELRAVVVNSKRLAEGESIGEMVLRAVTEDGILVDYRGQRVAVSVVETWN